MPRESYQLAERAEEKVKGMASAELIITRALTVKS
jgi:hypothetical protein